MSKDMDYKLQIFQLDDKSFAVWYKQPGGYVLEEYGFKTLNQVMRFLSLFKEYTE